ncbi:MAG TPA: ATP-binding protein, partial [Novosphingobium sp.]|nr:ATP-binding protein [Novosphingobium sp.]
ADVRLARRSVADDPVSQVWLMRRWGRLGGHQAPAALGLSAPPKAPTRLLVAAIQPQKNGPWLVARVLIPPAYDAGELLYALIAQTLIIYLVLVGVMALVLRRITRPLAALEKRLIAFAEHRQADGQLPPEGPEDLRRLILAHNRMEDRIAALLDEKDVMLGAIGHDLKTPLAALRVRIESVEDDTERARMAQTIDEIARTLDDILSLARVGRPSERLEMTELSALVAQVVEDYEDMGEPVLLEEMTRLSLPVRAIWLRRALRNLIGNALRYGGGARVNLARETVAGHSTARITIEDDGPGIPEAAIAAMMEPFRRGEPSRNSLTGGAGLGLTLARAIAEQHGGSLTLANRLDGAGQIAGLVATLSLPLP